MKLNEFQRAAVEERPKNITVSAAAGSGKTQVLGARVLNRIAGENPVDVSRLLIVTFTKAAAEEMRSRIGASVAEELRRETNPDRRRLLERQSALLGGADICTIDAFCYRLLRQNFFKVPGLSGDFTVGDEADVGKITSEAFKDVVEMFSAAAQRRRGGSLIPAYEKMADEFFRIYPDQGRADEILAGFDMLAMNYGSAKQANDFSGDSSDRKFSNDYVSFVRKIKDYVESAEDPQAWLNDCEADYSIPFDESRVGRYAVDVARTVANDVSAMLRLELGEGGLSPKNTALFQRIIDAIAAAGEPDSYAGATEMLSLKPLARLRASKDAANPNGAAHASDVLKKAREIWNEAAKRFVSTTEEIDMFRAKLRPAVVALCELTRCLIAEELSRCMEKKRLSFSACVTLTLKLLTLPDGSPSETALELRALYDEIYVDEAQDIDPRQMAIFRAISNGNLFMVGDVKQSIYGFRHAEPELFNARCEDNSDGSRLITMNLNYRSNRAVIDAVNGVFKNLINENTMDTDYSAMHEMLHGESWLPPDNPQPEFLAVIGGDDSAKSYNFKAEAQVVANKIKELLASGVDVYDKASGELRPIQKKDIIILMRSVKDDGPDLKQVLEENNIACYFDGGENLFSKSEISTVTDVLTLLDNDERDIPLAATLRSIMFGFNENDLLKIRSVSTGRSFSSVFRVLSDPDEPSHEEFGALLGDDELLGRCLAFGDRLRRWRRAADFRPISEVINMIITETDFYSSVGAMKGGRLLRANLDLLVEAADQFEAGGARGLFGFLEYIKRQNLGNNSTGKEAKMLSESMDVVRIMTIHKSKGLEAPVVILMHCSKPENENSNPLAIEMGLGFSMNYISEEKGYYNSSPLRKLISLRSLEKSRCEYIRLLYVAMTRPRERLICTGYFASDDELDKIASFDFSLSRSGVTFLGKSFATLLGKRATDGSLFNLVRIYTEEVEYPSLAKGLVKTEPIGENAVESFSRLLGFSYEYSGATALPAKVSVSALKAGIMDENTAETEFSRGDAPFRESLRTPAFAAGERKLTPAEIGTLYHTVMERLDFSRPAAKQLSEMVDSGIISPQEHKLIQADKIQTLINSPLGMRMQAAGRLYREVPFMMRVSAKQLSSLVAERGAENETVAVQGIIDCFFMEGDKIILVDYKTDSYTDPQNIAQKHEKQLEYYAMAINLKFSDKKIQKYLYLFHKNDIIEVN